MKHTVLLLDDDEDELIILSEALSLVGGWFNCIHERNTEDALNQIERCKPICVFVDMNMPRTNGLQCISSIVKRLPTSHPPLVLYTTTISSELCYNAIASGAIACIQKPHSVAALATVLKEFFQHVFGLQTDSQETIDSEYEALSDGDEIVLLEGKKHKKAFIYIGKTLP